MLSICLSLYDNVGKKMNLSKCLGVSVSVNPNEDLSTSMTVWVVVSKYNR